MLRLLEVAPGQRVLDVGSGSGWTTALLAHLVGPTGAVLGVELEPSLVMFGSANLAATGQPWASIRPATPGVLGVPDHAPYDRILVSAEPATLPQQLVDQLGDGGRLVIPVRGTMTLVTREGDETTADPPRLLPVRAASMSARSARYQVHPLVDVAGADRHHAPRGVPRRHRGAVGGRARARPDGLRAGRRLGAAVPRVRRGRARRHVTIVDLGVGTATSPAASWAPGPGRLPEESGRPRHRPRRRRHRRAHPPPRGPRRLGARPRRVPALRQRRARHPGHRGRGRRRRPPDPRGDRRPAAGGRPAARDRRCPTRSGGHRRRADARPHARSPVGVAVARATTCCCSPATCSCTPSSCVPEVAYAAEDDPVVGAATRERVFAEARGAARPWRPRTSRSRACGCREAPGFRDGTSSRPRTSGDGTSSLLDQRRAAVSRTWAARGSAWRRSSGSSRG